MNASPAPPRVWMTGWRRVPRAGKVAEWLHCLGHACALWIVYAKPRKRVSLEPPRRRSTTGMARARGAVRPHRRGRPARALASGAVALAARRDQPDPVGRCHRPDAPHLDARPRHRALANRQPRAVAPVVIRHDGCLLLERARPRE